MMLRLFRGVLMSRYLYSFIKFGDNQGECTEEEVRRAIADARGVFTETLRDAGYSDKKITAMKTKLCDAGRRSAPWQPASSKVPGRPQDGRDGNRIKRWLLPEDHKFYADEITATLVEIKYYLQLFSMKDAPHVGNDALDSHFDWLVEHPVKPGEYKDPITKSDLPFDEIINNPRLIQSGHIFPLDRGGKHEPSNTFLMSARSNALQGNMTVEELLEYIEDILRKHGRL